MAKFDLNQPIKNLDGTAMESQGEPVVFKDMIVNSLLSTGDAELKMEGKKRLELFELAKRIHGSNSQTDLSSGEIELIKGRCSKSATTYGYGVLCELLKI